MEPPGIVGFLETIKLETVCNILIVVLLFDEFSFFFKFQLILEMNVERSNL
jgi:hypothetical protein